MKAFFKRLLASFLKLYESPINSTQINKKPQKSLIEMARDGVAYCKKNNLPLPD